MVLGAFRQEVRRFLAEMLPSDLQDRAVNRRPIDKAEHVAWQQALDDRGWFAGHWPVEQGGAGWSRLQRWVFEQELDQAGAPWLMPFGVTYVAPVLYTFGNEEQRRRFLPAIRRSTDWWAQGYSEPAAGSDLAAVATRAVRDGGHYVVSGQKIWTSYAQHADRMFTLVRTAADGPPQRGVSFLLIDMTLPGVSVRPIETIDGERHVNEVFLDDVRVPVSDLVGDENAGWTYAKFLLNNERFLTAEVGKARRLIRRLSDLTADTASPERNRWRGRIAELRVDAMALEAAAVDLLGQVDRGAPVGSGPSMLKLAGSELLQRISGMTLELLEGRGFSIDPQANPDVGGVLREYLYGRAATIYGGTSEIQRNIIANAAGLYSA